MKRCAISLTISIDATRRRRYRVDEIEKKREKEREDERDRKQRLNYSLMPRDSHVRRLTVLLVGHNFPDTLRRGFVAGAPVVDGEPLVNLTITTPKAPDRRENRK